jgi:ornithine--oxo-acid transaminase
MMDMMDALTNSVDLEARYGAHNYEPLPITLVRGKGIYVWDDAGRCYVDMLGAYSAASFGHRHSRIVAALVRQVGLLDTTSRAFANDRLGPFLARACQLTGFDRALPMNSGAEAVETALKAARKWAYKIKGVPADRAEIICCEGNFHGRTIAATAMSSVPQYRDGFGPFPAGFVRVPFGNAEALARAITANTAAFLVEPIQGEGGIVLPPSGWLARCAEICRAHNVLLICDEIQTGLGRTGRLLACEHEGVKPDAITLGKALGGGLLPVSLFLAREEVMDVFTPGDHGSTFGGNPLSAAVGLEALDVLMEEKLVECSAELGAYFLQRLVDIRSDLIAEVRGKGLFIGIEFRSDKVEAHDVCLKLLEQGILTKDTHRNTVRFAPPLTITRAEIDTAVEAIGVAIREAERR